MVAEVRLWQGPEMRWRKWSGGPFDATWAAPCGEFQVTTSLNNYAVVGQVVATLPDGFTFVRTSLDDFQVEVEGRTLSFYLLDDSRLTCVVTVSATEGPYTFSGIINNSDREGRTIVGNTSLRVGQRPTPRPEPPATPRPEPTHTPVPTAVSTALPPLAPTPTASPAPLPTSSPAPTSTPEPTATPTPTAIPVVTAGATAERGGGPLGLWWLNPVFFGIVALIGFYLLYIRRRSR